MSETVQDGVALAGLVRRGEATAADLLRPQSPGRSR